MQHRQNGLPLPVHVEDQIHQFATGRFIDTREGLVEHHQRRPLHHHPGKQHALKLAAGERFDRGFRQARQPDPFQHRADASPGIAAQTAQQRHAGPCALTHHILHVERKL